MVKVKVCGVTRPEDAEFAVMKGADYVGVVMYPKSPRFVPPEKRKDIIRACEGALKVAVMVNPSFEEALGVLREGFDLIQLHGEESLAFATKLGLERVIKAFRVADEVPHVEGGWERAHAILLDTYSKKAYGGTGRTFDWRLARKVVEEGFRVFLSGGLSPENVRGAIEEVLPFAVDVSSGVELKPGIKDKMKVERFIKEAKFL